MAEAEPKIRVTEEQIEFFCREGFLAIERITSDAEVERLRATYDELFARRAGREEGRQYDLAGTDEEDSVATLPQILEPRQYAAQLRNTLYEANGLAIAGQLLGGLAETLQDRVLSSEVVDFGLHAILKPAGIGSETPWHQDEAYWDPAKYFHGLSVWMPLQEVTEENGCMCFIPGTHTGEVMSHHHAGDDPRIEALVVDDGHIDISKAVVCPIPAGGATFHFCRTFHYTGPNRSVVPRRALALTCGLPQSTREVPRDFYWQGEKRTNAGKRREEAARRLTESEKS